MVVDGVSGVSGVLVGVVPGVVVGVSGVEVGRSVEVGGSEVGEVWSSLVVGDGLAVGEGYQP